MRQKETILENKINSCRLLCSMVVLDQATGSSYMLVAYLSYWIHLPFSLHKLCACPLHMSVSTCYSKANKRPDTTCSILINPTNYSPFYLGGSISASHPAAPGSNPGSTPKFADSGDKKLNPSSILAKGFHKCSAAKP